MNRRNVASRHALSLLGLAFALSFSPRAVAAPTVPQCLDASERGQELRDRGSLSRARDQFSTCSASSCPGPVRTSCAKWLESVVANMPSIVVAARDERDNDVIGASLVVDGVPHEKVSGQAVTLDPGPHTVVVTAPQFEKSEQKVVVSTGEKNRFIRVIMTRSATPPAVPASDPAPAPAPADPPPKVATGEAPPPTTSSPGSAWPPPLAIGLGGLALAGAGVSLALGLSARSDVSDLEASPCASNKTCDAATLDDLRARFILADVALGVAVVAAAAAIVVWVATPSSRSVALRRSAAMGAAGFAF